MHTTGTGETVVVMLCLRVGNDVVGFEQVRDKLAIAALSARQWPVTGYESIRLTEERIVIVCSPVFADTLEDTDDLIPTALDITLLKDWLLNLVSHEA